MCVVNVEVGVVCVEVCVEVGVVCYNLMRSFDVFFCVFNRQIVFF